MEQPLTDSGRRFCFSFSLDFIARWIRPAVWEFIVWGLKGCLQLVPELRVAFWDGQYLEMGISLLWPKIPRHLFSFRLTIELQYMFKFTEHCMFFIMCVGWQLKVIPVPDNQFHACIIHTHYLKLPWCKMSGGMICVCMKSIMDLYIFFILWSVISEIFCFTEKKRKKKSDKAIKRPRDLISMLEGHRTLTGQYVNLVQR